MTETNHAEIVLQCIRKHCANDRLIDRQAVIRSTGLTVQQVKKSVGMLKDTGQITVMGKGVYQCQQPARVISRTILPDGVVVLDIGDEVIHLSAQEDHMLSKIYGAYAVAQEIQALVRIAG